MPSPYVPNTPQDRAAMLESIGIKDVKELFQDIPVSYREPRLGLPPPLPESELLSEISALAQRNANTAEYACFLGAGAYNHFIPAVIHHITSRNEFYTAYTPYQPEISQGTIQAIYEYQSLVCQLTDMEVSNAGMYDGASALAEAALMACRITGKYRVAATASLSPAYLAVLHTYLDSRDISIEVVKRGEVSRGHACLLAQSPNFFGYLEDMKGWSQECKTAEALLVVATDPISLGMLRPPGEYDADIVVAEGQSLGVSLSFGGPYLGVFASRDRYLRQMPGRIAGRTTDREGRVGYVTTLQTREQHIRRERATSNICTNENLVALAATVYLTALGKQGLRRVAELCYHKAHYAASLIAQIPGYSLPLPGVFFKEFVVSCPRPPQEINQALLEQKIIGGLDISDMVPNGMLLCVTEMNIREQIETLAQELARLGRGI